MIIRHLSARNFMRYQELRLDDIPADGVVAVIGENESGKTTIGEAIAFALFGETVKSRATDFTQVISWDAEEAEVAVEVDSGKSGILRVVRRATKSGAHEARLYRAPEAPPGLDPAAPLPPSESWPLAAEGPEKVAEALRDALGLTFDEFRHSFYLAQAELALGRSPEDQDGRRVLQEIVGIGTLERAAEAEGEALEKVREHALDIARNLTVARALAEAHRLPAGYGEELEKEGQRADALRKECERRLPDLAATVGRLKDAEQGRGAAMVAFERLSRAIVLGRAERAEASARADLGAVARGLEAESNRWKRDLAHREKTLGEVRARVDRLIDYQAKMAELEARLDLYKTEVKRSLDAPEIEEEDLEELEGFALPATPAAGLKLCEARVDRLKRARSKALGRAATYGVLAAVAALVGVPSVWHVVKQETPVPAGLDQLLSRGVKLLAEMTTISEAWGWLGLTLLGFGFLILCGILSYQRARKAMQRGDQLKLATEATTRLAGEVKALQSERQNLESLDLRKPVKFADAVKELKNQTLAEQFQKIREVHNDFISSPEQKDELVQKERKEEARLREEAQAVEAKLARFERLRRLIPADVSTGRGDEEAIPERFEAAEARLKHLLDQLEEAQRDRREVERSGGSPGEPLALFRAVQDPLERVWKGVGSEQGGAPLLRNGVGAPRDSLPRGGGGTPPETAQRQGFLSRTRLPKIAGAPGEFAGQELRQALDDEQKLLLGSIPLPDELVKAREAAENEHRTCEGNRAMAAAKLAGLAERLEEVREKKTRFAEASKRAGFLEAELSDHRREVELHELVVELLDEAAADLRRRVGPMLSRYASSVIPKLTNGRYRRVRISPDLDIRIYSPEKNDWVPLVDLSIGAADQLLLSIRFAVGRALALAKGKAGERHFLFLDEPMSSFDEGRARAFLELVREHRDVFPQVFVVSHVHLQGVEKAFRKVLTPTLDSRTLGVEAPVPVPEPVPVPDGGGDEVADLSALDEEEEDEEGGEGGTENENENDEEGDDGDEEGDDDEEEESEEEEEAEEAGRA